MMAISSNCLNEHGHYDERTSTASKQIIICVPVAQEATVRKTSLKVITYVKIGGRCSAYETSCRCSISSMDGRKRTQRPIHLRDAIHYAMVGGGRQDGAVESPYVTGLLRVCEEAIAAGREVLRRVMERNRERELE